jgi:predicted enzyme related to lactoylglutathione lyase
MHGQFVWYELTTPDVDGAKKFYPRFTNWGTQRFDENYTTFTTGGLPIAGIFRLNDEMRGQGIPPNWMPYVEVNDVDASAAQAKSLGATITAGPDDIPGTGRFAVVQDPQGAVFGIYKSNTQSNAWDGTNTIDRFSWHELMTSDHEQASKFYSALFGWEKISEMDMGAGAGMYYMYGLNGKMYGGMFTTPPEMAGMHPFWLVYIHVKDVAKAVAIATKNGATIQRPQMDIPGGSIAILGDPQGAGFALHHSAAPVAAKAVAAVQAAVKKAVASVVTAVKKRAAPKKKAKSKAKAPARKPAKVVKKTKARAKPKAKARPKAKAKAKARPKAKAMAKSASRKRSTTRARPRRKAKAKK